MSTGSIRGRGAAENPPNRFVPLVVERDPESDQPEELAARTQFFHDSSQSLITYNNSPDIPFSASINPYRGCEHGCVYCYARPFHEYLGFSAGLDFETKILVKQNAPALLRRELLSPRWQPQTLSLSGVTDPYQPVERQLQVTRACLKVLVEFRNPVAIVTKNRLITRDVDLLANLAQHQAAAVYVSVTTLDAGLARVMEPRTASPAARLETIATLAQAGVPVGVLVAPVIPGLTDHEIPAILQAVGAAGARFGGMIPLRLPLAVQELFLNWLTRHFPDRREKVLQQIRSIRGGRLNDATFGRRMEGEGIVAEQLAQLFTVAARRAGVAAAGPSLSVSAFRRPPGNQLELFATT